jgi:hypothetical protein
MGSRKDARAKEYRLGMAQVLVGLEKRLRSVRFAEGKIVKAIIRKQTWTIRDDTRPDEFGYCDLEGDRGQPRTIGIRSGLDEGQDLDTTLHECLHAAMPDLSEDAVTEIASDLARVLLARGFGRS